MIVNKSPLCEHHGLDLPNSNSFGFVIITTEAEIYANLVEGMNPEFAIRIPALITTSKKGVSPR